MIGHVGIWGRSGSGKTTRAKALLQERQRVIVFDPLDEHGGPGYPTLSDVLGNVKQAWGSDFIIRYVPPDDREPVAELDRLADLVRQVQAPFQEGRETRSLTLLVEEMAMCFPNVRRPSSAFAGLCNRGRHFGVELIGTSQRMADVSPSFRGNTSADYFFPLRAQTDYEAGAQLIGRDQVENLKRLEDHHYLVFKDGTVSAGRNS